MHDIRTKCIFLAKCTISIEKCRNMLLDKNYSGNMTEFTLINCLPHSLGEKEPGKRLKTYCAWESMAFGFKHTLKEMH